MGEHLVSKLPFSSLPGLGSEHSQPWEHYDFMAKRLLMRTSLFMIQWALLPACPVTLEKVYTFSLNLN